jgi:asparaginyl-tRNA synthetase
LIHNGEYIKDILAREPGAKVAARGWVKTRRDGKGVHFVQLQDGSSAIDLQVVILAGLLPEAVLAALTTGSSVRVAGEVVASPGPGQPVELRAEAVEVYNSADPATYPLQKKGHTMEFLREIAHLRSRSNTFSAVFRVRNALCYAIHRFFQDNGFLYIQTPLITALDAEGAGAMFQVTTLDLAATPKRPKGGPISAATSSPSRPTSRSAGSSKPRCSRTLSPTSTPSGRPSGPRIRTRRATWPSSG